MSAASMLMTSILSSLHTNVTSALLSAVSFTWPTLFPIKTHAAAQCSLTKCGEGDHKLGGKYWAAQTRPRTWVSISYSGQPASFYGG